MAINLRAPHHAWKNRLSRTIHMENIGLRPFCEPDRKAFETLLADGRIYTHIRDFSHESDGLSWFRYASENRHYFWLSIVKPSDNHPLGFLVFQYIPGRGIRLGGAIAPEHWNKGVATRILKGLKEYIKPGDLPVPLYAEVERENIAVRRAFEKSGYHPMDGSASDRTLVYHI